MYAMVVEIDQLLRLNGIQVTAQRIAIMDAVSDNPHATAEELTEEVRLTTGAISKQSVYDSLGMLVDKNLVRKIQPAGSPARYENRVGDNHHHLICRECRLMFDIDCEASAVPCMEPNDNHGFEIDEAEVVYWGRCATCRSHQPSTDSKPSSLNEEPTTLNNQDQKKLNNFKEKQ